MDEKQTNCPHMWKAPNKDKYTIKDLTGALAIYLLIQIKIKKGFWLDVCFKMYLVVHIVQVYLAGS